MPKFTRIYFDTNILKQGWPELSARVVNVFDLARSLGAELVFPHVTLVELEKHWLEEWRSTRNALFSAIGRIKKLLGIIALDLESIAISAVPTSPEVVGEYGKRVESLMREFGITSAPLTQRSLEDVLQMAIKRQLTFGDDGKNFQDTMLFLSVVDHLQAEARPPVSAFVSADAIFRAKRESLAEFARNAKLEIIFYESIDEIANELENRKSAEEKRQIEADKQTVISSVSAEKGRLLEWLNSSQPKWSFQTFLGIVYVSTRVLGVDEIVDAVGPLRSNWRVGLMFPISFDVKASVEFASYSLPSIPFRLTAPKTLDDIAPLRSDTIVHVNRIIAVDANAIFTGAGFELVDFINASLRPPTMPPSPAVIT